MDSGRDVSSFLETSIDVSMSHLGATKSWVISARKHIDDKFPHDM